MQISNKYAIFIVIILIIIIWYTYSVHNDANRYKKIIDTYINTDEKKVKPIIKKVTFKEDNNSN